MATTQEQKIRRHLEIAHDALNQAADLASANDVIGTTEINDVCKRVTELLRYAFNPQARMKTLGNLRIQLKHAKRAALKAAYGSHSAEAYVKDYDAAMNQVRRLKVSIREMRETS